MNEEVDGRGVKEDVTVTDAKERVERERERES
jgi:hypothetical protein